MIDVLNIVMTDVLPAIGTDVEMVTTVRAVVMMASEMAVLLGLPALPDRQPLALVSSSPMGSRAFALLKQDLVQRRAPNQNQTNTVARWALSAMMRDLTSAPLRHPRRAMCAMLCWWVCSHQSSPSRHRTAILCSACSTSGCTPTSSSKALGAMCLRETACASTSGTRSLAGSSACLSAALVATCSVMTVLTALLRLR